MFVIPRRYWGGRTRGPPCSAGHRRPHRSVHQPGIMGSHGIYGGFMVDLWWIYGGLMVDLWWIDGGFMVD